MSLAFRNLMVTPEDPVEQWGVEGILTAIDRGSLSHWRKIQRAVKVDPWGQVSQNLAQALELAEDRGAVSALSQVLVDVRDREAQAEREQVASQVREFIEASGLTQAEFSVRIGTSASRLSTYSNGKTTPSAAMMLRMAKTSQGRAVIPTCRAKRAAAREWPRR